MEKKQQPNIDPNVTPAEVIGKAIEILGPNGEHWITGDLEDGKGNYCMLGAINKARTLLSAKGSVSGAAKRLIVKHIPDTYRWGISGIATFNDFHDYDNENRFPAVKAVMCNALKEAAISQQETPVDADRNETK